MARMPNRSQLGDASGASADLGIAPGFPVPDGLVAGRERMERVRREEEERLATEQERLAARETSDEGGPARITRATRKPFGSHAQKLLLPKRPGFQRHWFNDNPGRIDEALAAGYEYVLDAQGRPISRVVGRTDRGDGLRAYAMEVLEEWYREDMKVGQDLVDKNAAGIKRGDLYGFDQSYLSARTKVTDSSR